MGDSAAYAEIGGRGYDTQALAKQIPCPRCRAAVDASCVNPVTGKPARIACWERVYRAEHREATK